MSRVSDSALYRWAVLSRVLAAALGGYFLTSAAISFLALTLPMPRDQAVGLATMLGFIVYAVLILWVFATRSLWRVWAWMLIPGAVFSALVWWLKQGGAA